jgi:hypothetical protein
METSMPPYSPHRLQKARDMGLAMDTPSSALRGTTMIRALAQPFLFFKKSSQLSVIL